MFISWKISAVFLTLLTCTGVISYPHEKTTDRTTHALSLQMRQPEENSAVVPLVSIEWLEERIVKVYKRPRAQASDIASAIIEASQTFNIRWQILSSMIGAESSFNPDARSFAGAIGPLQVRPQIWGYLDYDLTNTRQNVMAGAYILQGYKARCGSWECAIAAYNVGITNFTRNKKRNAQQRYMAKVSSKMRFWK